MNGYRQFCGTAKALDILGERWTLLIVRDLLLGPRRFTDLHVGLKGITTNLLSQRLKMLAEEGLVESVAVGGSARAYALTPLGCEVEPVVLALGAFGSRYLDAPGEDAVDPRWAMVSLKRRYGGAKRAGRVGFCMGEQAFALDFDPQGIRVRDGKSERPQATLAGPMAAWFPLLTRRAALEPLLAARRLSVTGSRPTLNALLRALGVKLR